MHSEQHLGDSRKPFPLRAGPRYSVMISQFFWGKGRPRGKVYSSRGNRGNRPIMCLDIGLAALDYQFSKKKLIGKLSLKNLAPA